MKIDDERLKELCAKGLTPTMIAQRFGCSVSGVHLAFKRLGIRARIASNGDNKPKVRGYVG
jgi:hypothetical protein